jgi:hypothetical protein
MNCEAAHLPSNREGQLATDREAATRKSRSTTAAHRRRGVGCTPAPRRNVHLPGLHRLGRTDVESPPRLALALSSAASDNTTGDRRVQRVSPGAKSIDLVAL